MTFEHELIPGKHRAVHLEARVASHLTPQHFSVVEEALAPLKAGEALVRNRVMAISAAMRTMMTGAELPIRRYVTGAPLWGPAVGEIVSVAPDSGFDVGEVVRHDLGWRGYAVVNASNAERVDPRLRHDPAVHLSQGSVAWLALTRVARVSQGDTVFISGAAGGVGSLAGQIARRRGASRVVGSTGSPHKVASMRTELGYDAVVLRGNGSIAGQLHEAAPAGVDVACDTVGGEELQAALAAAKQHAHVVVLGALSGQLGGDESMASPVELDSSALVTRRLTVQGVSLRDHPDAEHEWIQEFSNGLADGTLRFPHVRYHDLEQAPRALCDLTSGKHVGGVLVEL